VFAFVLWASERMLDAGGMNATGGVRLGAGSWLWSSGPLAAAACSCRRSRRSYKPLIAPPIPSPLAPAPLPPPPPASGRTLQPNFE
jgi:hypothetical protein